MRNLEEPSHLAISDSAQVQLFLESVDRTKEFSSTPTQLVQLKPAETQKNTICSFKY